MDGSLKLGSGYVIAPRLMLLPYGGVVDWERIPLQETDEPTASVADFGSIDLNLAKDDETYGAYTLGASLRLLSLLRSMPPQVEKKLSQSA